MTKVKHTPGPWTVDYKTGTILGPIEPIYRPCKNYYAVNPSQTCNADAELIAEAGTVASETGLTPRQLAEQRAELLAALQHIATANPNTGDAFDKTRQLSECVSAANAAIAKATAQD